MPICYVVVLLFVGFSRFRYCRRLAEDTETLDVAVGAVLYGTVWRLSKISRNKINQRDICISKQDDRHSSPKQTAYPDNQ